MFPTLLTVTYNPYIPWDTKVFERGIAVLRNNIGSAVTMGLYAFLILASIYVVVYIFRRIGR